MVNAAANADHLVELLAVLEDGDIVDELACVSALERKDIMALADMEIDIHKGLVTVRAGALGLGRHYTLMTTSLSVILGGRGISAFNFFSEIFFCCLPL